MFVHFRNNFLNDNRATQEDQSVRWKFAANPGNFVRAIKMGVTEKIAPRHACLADKFSMQ